MQQKGFIFIPDISGFTNFVNSVELNHSHHVIKEFNETGLKIPEIEGDAILFYRLGEVSDLEVVYAQVESFPIMVSLSNMKSVVLISLSVRI